MKVHSRILPFSYVASLPNPRIMDRGLKFSNNRAGRVFPEESPGTFISRHLPKWGQPPARASISLDKRFSSSFPAINFEARETVIPKMSAKCFYDLTICHFLGIVWGKFVDGFLRAERQ
jgi:hypothetical protein